MNNTQSVGVDLDLTPARRCMLLERVAEIFDEIPMANPVQRAMIVGRAVQMACQENEAVKNMIIETRFLERLKIEAKARAGGDISYPPPLQSEITFGKENMRV